MKIFIDSADLGEIEKYLSWGICDGVTMNPTICLKCGVTGGMAGIKERTLKIAQLIEPHPISVEVTSDNIVDIISQAQEYASWAENIAVKVTITDREGNSLLPAIHQLVADGIRVNVTAMMTFNQMVFAAKCIESARQKNSATHFISLFAGRIADEQGTGQAVRALKQTREWLSQHGYSSEIIVGSIRRAENVSSYAATGAHILTIPPNVISECLLSARTKETVIQFLMDANKALETVSNPKYAIM